MSTPPTPAPPPRREGRRFAIPTPADLRHPGSRRDPGAPEGDQDPDSDAAAAGAAPAAAAPGAAADAGPEGSGADGPAAENGVAEPRRDGPEAGSDAHPEVTLQAAPAGVEQRTEVPAGVAPGADATPATSGPPAPRGPTPATLPRPGRPSSSASVTTAPPAPRTDSESMPAVEAGGDASGGGRGTGEDAGEGSRRLFPNPATLMAAGRGVRKVRPGSLRGRRLPKVEETSAGGVVLDLSSDPPAVALIARHDRRSRLLWSLPKGHVEEGETPEQAALREVLEETGLVGRIVAPLGVIDFWFVVEDKRIHKTVHHYVIEAVGGELSDEDVEVEAVEWIPFHQVVRKLAYGDERRLVEKVPQIVPGVK